MNRTVLNDSLEQVNMRAYFDTALAWYNSPTYQALLDIRNAALDCRFRLVG
jgi:uncharacterized protein (DUF1330 family)